MTSLQLPVPVGHVGIIPRSAALAAGMTDQEIARLVRGKQWRRVRRGAYVDAELWGQLDSAGRHRLLVHAVMARLDVPAVVSHVSALVLLGLPTWGHDLRFVHVSRADLHSSRTEAGVKHHAGALAPDEIVDVDGLAVTSPSRALVDAARYASFEAAVVSADAALNTSLTSADDLRDALDRSVDWPGNRRAVRAVEFADGRSESVGESRGRVAFHLAGLPVPELQVEFHDVDGSVLARTDYYFPAHRTIGEFDGRVKYGRSLAPETDLGDVVWREKRREDALRDRGYEVARLIWADLDNLADLAARFRAAFARAASARTASTR